MLDDLLPQFTFLFGESSELLDLILDECNIPDLSLYDVVDMCARDLGLTKSQLSSALRYIAPDQVGRTALQLYRDAYKDGGKIIFTDCKVLTDVQPFIDAFGADNCLVVKYGELPQERPCALVWLAPMEASKQFAELIRDRTSHLRPVDATP